MKKIKPGIWEISEVPEVISRLSNVFSADEIQNSPKKRTRICTHSSTDSDLQEMFIAFSFQSYIRPSAHIDRLESMLIIEGRCKYLSFGNNGDKLFDVRMGDYTSELFFYIRTPRNSLHSLIPLSDKVIAHEVSEGPFSELGTYYPDWSCEEEEAAEVGRFIDAHTYSIVSPIYPAKIVKNAAGQYQCTEVDISLRRADIDNLISIMELENLNFLTLEINNQDECKISERFIVAKKGMHKINFSHPDIENSYHIVDGELNILINDNVLIRENYDLSSNPCENSNGFYIKIPGNCNHTMTVKSDFALIYHSSIR